MPERLRVQGHARHDVSGSLSSWRGACECGTEFRGHARTDVTSARVHKTAAAVAATFDAAGGGATDGDA